ncbi:MAG: HAMP domain-containing sensor histidine kinase [Spirosomataceae bacterium]
MKKINVLIGFMLLGLLGLMAFQWYWIKNAYEIKNAEFDRKVNDVLKETVLKLEKQEIMYLTKKRIELEDKRRLLEIAKGKRSKKNQSSKIPLVEKSAIKTDSMVFAYHDGNTLRLDPKQVITIDIHSNQFPKNDFVSTRYLVEPDLQKEFFGGFLEEEFENIENLNQKILRMSKLNEKFEVLFRDLENDSRYPGVGRSETMVSDDINVYQKKPHIPDNKTKVKVNWSQNNEQKTELLKDVFKEFTIGKRSVSERLGHVMLDTLLKKSFAENGISLPFYYRVNDNNKLIFANFNKFNSDPEIKNYKVKLFPNDALQHQQFIEVGFPNRENYIIRNLWSVFGSSILLIGFIGAVFYYSVNTMLNQKKLANIKNDFINNMTHELKTPVSTISLALEFIKDKTVSTNSEKTEKYLNIIEQENRRLGSQIETVLQIAKLEKGDINLRHELLEINEILDQVVKNHAVQIEKFDATLDLDLHAEETNVMADKVHLTNIFYNLLDNAIKYSYEKPQIKISTSNTDNQLSVKISDKGMGIPKEHLNKIFDKFYRVPKGNLHDVKGFGLGLSYVKNMVELHHGTIEVSSKPGEGSEFTVLLPLQKS